MRRLALIPLFCLIVSSCVLPGGSSETQDVVFTRISNNQSSAKGNQKRAVASGDIKARTGDRWFVYNTLLAVFGPSVQTILRSNIIAQIASFGGSCDIQEHSKDSNYELEFPDLSCFDSTLSVKSFLSSSVLREGWRVRTCEQILDSDTALDFAINRISDSNNPDNLVLNAGTLTAGYNLFQPGRTLSEPQIQALTALSDHFEGNNREKWRHVLLAYCVDPIWQIP